MLCSAPRARARRRPRRHPDPRPRPRRRARRSARRARHRRRRPLRPRDQPQPARRHVGGRRGPRPGGPAAACRSPCRRRRSPSRRRRSPAGASVEIVDPDLCGRFDGPGARAASRSARRPRGWPTGCTLLGMRPINNVVDVSNYVMLELGQPNHTYDLAKVAGRRLAGALGPRRRDASRTLDGVERTLDRRRRRDLPTRDDVAVGIAGVMGGASTEISDTTTDVLLEMAWWRPDDDRRSRRSRLEPAQRGVGPLRAGHRPRDRRAGRAPLRRAARRAVGRDAGRRRGRRARRPARPRRRSRCAPPGSTPCSAPTSAATDDRRLLEPIGFDVDRRSGDDLRRRRSRRSGSTRATEIDVIEEVARHHGYSRIPRTRPARGARRLAHRAPARPARGSAQVLVGLGLDEAMPLPFLAPGDLARVRAARRRHHAHQPAGGRGVGAAHLAAPGPAQGVAYNESHRNHGVALFEIGKVVPPPLAGASSCPTSASSLGVGAGRRATPRTPSRCGACWPRRSASTALALEQAARRRAAPDPRRPRSSSAGDVVGAVGEIDPGVLDALRHRRAGRPGSRSTSTALLDRPHGDAAVPAGQPVPVERHRPGLRGRRRRRRPPPSSDAIRGRGRRPARRRRLFDVFRGDGRGRRPPQPGLPPAAPGPRPHPHRRRRRRGPRPCIEGAAALGARLRG